MKKTTKKEAAPMREKMQALHALAAECNKALKSEGRVLFADDAKVYDRIQTGILGFDIVTGGGLPRGALTELYGPESCGKTLLCNMIVAETQRQGGSVVWVAGEQFDKEWARARGVRLNELFLVEAVHGDTKLETAMTFLESGFVDLMVFDSFQAFGTKREAEGGVESESYAGGGAPQLWGKVMKRSYAAVSSGKGANTALLGVSQVREAIGKHKQHGPTYEPTNIRAIRHWKSISIECSRGELEYTADDESRQVIQRLFKLNCKKNKTAPSDKKSSYFFQFIPTKENPIVGVDHIGQLVKYGIMYGLFKQSGSWIEGEGIRAQGKEAFSDKLRSIDPKKAQAMYKQLLALGLES